MKRLLPWCAARQAAIMHILLSLLLAGTGWFALQWREILWPKAGNTPLDWRDLGMDPFQSLSYDLPFLLRSSLPSFLRPLAGSRPSTDGVVLLYMDEQSAKELGQTPGRAYTRSLHAKLLARLAADGATAVVFDAIFDSDSPDDPAFAQALAAHGGVFLGASIDSDHQSSLTPDQRERLLQTGIATEQLSKRNKLLYKSAKGWGLLTFRPIDADYGVRRLFPGKPRDGLDPWSAISWQVARFAGAPLPADDHPSRFQRRWINFYGPPNSLQHASYSRALQQEGGIAPEFFRNKIVLIGARSQLASGPGKLLDEFSTPWARFSGRSFTPGLEIHAISLLNLLHHDWLDRLPLHTESAFVLLLGLALGALRYLKPLRALGASLLIALAVTAAALHLQWQHHLWSNWSVPVLLQIPLAAIAAVVSRYYLEERNKRKLRSAFGFYLSEKLAEEISERSFSLAPGGQKVQATMMFTDIEGFTTLSEALGDSARLGSELVRYFTKSTDIILEEHGTVIKFIGDAVFAAWGAPVPQNDQAERAVRAALALAEATRMQVEVPSEDGSSRHVSICTRIGIHTGEALAGNLGSARRFDYTLIGDSVNFAARLEGLNKYTGTTILLSEATAHALKDQFVLRPLGVFQVKGKLKGVSIHEPLSDSSLPPPDWLPLWHTALDHWNTQRLQDARAAFESVRSLRNGSDGPSEFYLARLEKLALHPHNPASPWTGIVALDEK